jgi:hypothetical protein
MPDLIIIDGLVGQEDFGPVSGSPRKMDLLIAGTNPVAVDAVALNIMGLTPWDSPPVLMAHYEGMGPVTWESIEVKGLSVDDLSCSFKRPVINLESGKCFKVHDGNACPFPTGTDTETTHTTEAVDPYANCHLFVLIAFSLLTAFQCCFPVADRPEPRRGP